MDDKHTNSSSIVVRSIPGTSPEEDRDASARAWAFVFDSYDAKKNAASVSSTNGDDAKKGSLKHEVRANTSIP